MNNSNFKTAIFWVVIIVVVVLFWTVVHNTKSRPDAQLSYTQLMNDVNAGKIKTVTISGNDLHGVYKDDNQELHAVIPNVDQSLKDAMLAKGVDLKYNKEAGGGWVSILINAIPFVLLLAFWIFMMRQMQSGGNKALSFGKSRARLHSSQQKKVTFKDVAGVEEAKEELQEIIEFLREPQKFQKLGGRIPKGVLLIGPPGTGKTLLGARHRGRSERSVLLDLRFGLSWRCSWAWAPAACAICSSRARRTRRASSSSMKSTPWAAIAARAWAADTMSASRRSINCWWRWTASNRTKA